MDIDKLNETLYEAEEVPVIKDGDLKLPLEELVIRNYDEQTRPFGRARKSFTDWITEYNYVSEKSLSKEEFLKIINEKEKPTGLDYEPIKVKLTYGDGKVYYRHILKTATF